MAGMPDKLKVYISGPISDGGRATPDERLENVKRAAFVASDLMKLGFAVNCPQLTEFIERLTEERLPHSLWIENDLPWVRAADVVLRLSGASTGSDMEVAEALRVGVPVVYSVDELREFQALRRVNRFLASESAAPLEGLEWK